MKFNSNPKLILFQTALHKPGGGSGGGGASHRLWLLAFASFFTFVLLITLLTTRDAPLSSASSSAAFAAPLSADVVDALLHYSSNSNATGKMPHPELRAVADALHGCSPCNFLVFGLGPETLLWRALNHNGRTVFLDENEYYIAMFEEKHPRLEAYDVQYTSKVSQMWELLASAREQIRKDCRPVQNLLFSDCVLGINDLPNQLYDVSWDVILVDGPRSYSPSAPGRMSSIFTAGVLARSKKAGPPTTHVFVHDYNREVERVCSEEFLCKENMVGKIGLLAHFVVERMDEDAFDFCHNHTSSSSLSISSTTA
ncbi:hypothetical protein ACLOJK_038390 [Asimina triloba]